MSTFGDLVKRRNKEALLEDEGHIGMDAGMMGLGMSDPNCKRSKPMKKKGKKECRDKDLEQNIGLGVLGFCVLIALGLAIAGFVISIVHINSGECSDGAVCPESDDPCVKYRCHEIDDNECCVKSIVASEECAERFSPVPPTPPPPTPPQDLCGSCCLKTDNARVGCFQPVSDRQCDIARGSFSISEDCEYRLCRPKPGFCCSWNERRIGGAAVCSEQAESREFCEESLGGIVIENGVCDAETGACIPQHDTIDEHGGSCCIDGHCVQPLSKESCDEKDGYYSDHSCQHRPHHQQCSRPHHVINEGYPPVPPPKGCCSIKFHNYKHICAAKITRQECIEEHDGSFFLNGTCSGEHGICIPPKNSECDPTPAPTKSPTKAPTEQPTKQPTKPPTKQPTKEPTKTPTKEPTKEPTKYPTKEPTKYPTKRPTERPTKLPTREPTELPTKRPTLKPPTELPTPYPTKYDEYYQTK